ncbi:uncharacterized protein si:ch211-127m7.2 isoform X1 [Sander lucioperca]|uniref:uncharacterized protein si:ch211-127m7.2 isoform X1 n=1 Tax=Sander lucioperca TaxID=283035 RepID=UPI0016535195|nr:uncharacterized protein si:ch211-127m7.2 isoform X1 [Sander lucioperca]
MSERHRRALPPWMAKKEENVKKEPLKSRRKQKTTRAAFYCMNEKELVEAAVSYLTNAACADVDLLTDQKVEDKAVDNLVKIRENTATSKAIAKPVTLEEESSDCGDASEKTYVSETDLDITEVETLPYTKSPQHQGPGGQESGPVQDRGGLVNVGLEAEEKEEHSQMPTEAAEEDDAMRLVREIFFT